MKTWHALAIIAILLFAGCTAVAGPERKTQSELVDVGGHSLNFVVTEGNGPTVLLEAGQGADSSMWSAVQSILANTTDYRVISYDRAGFGKSEADPGDYSIAREVSALEAGLSRLNATGGVIYVAHSYGAFLAQEYAARNPGKVKAFVLADPNTACFNVNGGFDAVWLPPPYQNTSDANKRVLYAYPLTINEMNLVPPYPSVPMVVVTSGFPPVPAGSMAALWRSCQQKLVQGNAHGEYWIAQNSSHLIPIDDPGIIVAAIRKAG